MGKIAFLLLPAHKFNMDHQAIPHKEVFHTPFSIALPLETKYQPTDHILFLK